MDGSKSWTGSAGVWGGVVAVAAGGANLLGYTISVADQAALASSLNQMVTLVTSIVGIAGGIVAIYGRVKATKVIAKPAA